MVGFVGGAGGSFDYVQDSQPDAPLKGESWYDTDANGGDGEVKVYDGAEWNITGFTSHGDLTGITVDAHHSPVTVDTPLTEDGTQELALSIGDGLGDVGGSLTATLGDGLVIDANGNVAASLGNGLTIDGSGRVSIPAGVVDTNELADAAVTSAIIAAGAVGENELGFDTATQSELDSHAGDTTNPHNVTDDQTGAATALTNHTSDGSAHVPSGVITMWSGSAGNVPSGWTLCDGTDGAPDLRGRFVIGAGGSYSSGDTGGQASGQLSNGEMPSHSHGANTDTAGSHSHRIPTEDNSGNYRPVKTGNSEYYGYQSLNWIESAGDHSHNVNVGTAGSDNAHENRPPYYSLAYIMKL